MTWPGRASGDHGLLTLEKLPQHHFLWVLFDRIHHFIWGKNTKPWNIETTEVRSRKLQCWATNEMLLHRSSMHSGLMANIDSYMSSEIIETSWEPPDITSYTSAFPSMLAGSSAATLGTIMAAVSWEGQTEQCDRLRYNITLRTQKGRSVFVTRLTTNLSISCLRSEKPLFSASLLG